MREVWPWVNRPCSSEWLTFIPRWGALMALRGCKTEEEEQEEVEEGAGETVQQSRALAAQS